MKTPEIIQSKIYTIEQLKKAIGIWRFKEDKIVFTNGCFDLIHLGHVQYLAEASDLGNRLIIGLNTDNSVSKLKGKHRPIKDQQSRATILASFSFIDAVILFDEETPINLISELKPNVLVKGGDYEAKSVVGYGEVKKNGGEVVIIDFIQGHSSTLIEQKINRG